MAHEIRVTLADEAAEKLDHQLRYGAGHWAYSLDQSLVDVAVTDSDSLDNTEEIAVAIEAALYQSFDLHRVYRQ